MENRRCEIPRKLSRDPVCRNSCQGNALVGFIRNFCAGLAVKVLVKLLRSLVVMKAPALLGRNGLVGPGTLQNMSFQPAD